MKKLWLVTVLILLGITFYVLSTHFTLHLFTKVGAPIDNIDSVNVYYNGNVYNIKGQNIGRDGYLIGQKYQCVEFVKRYYYQHYHHKMPNVYGNAKDFFIKGLPDGALNKQRGLRQFKNGSKTRPHKGDLLVFDATSMNEFGHVAIISNVSDNEIEIIQQNPGPFGKSRITLNMNNNNSRRTIEKGNILGWLRLP